LYYCDPYDIPLPEGHKFPMEKYRLIRHELERNGRFRFAVGPLARREEILAVHAAEYVDAVLDGQLGAAEVRRIGFPQVPELVTRTLSSVGGTVAAAREALRCGWSGVLAGGTHHAYREFGSGFCVFNDIAVAAVDLLRNGLAGRVAVVDFDVHQGDGTAAIFANEPRVFTLSLHGRDNFPFRKMRSDLDVEFASGTGDAEYLAAVERALAAVGEWGPDFVFYQCGVDGLVEDRFGKLALTRAGLRVRNELVFAAVQEWGVPCVLTLGGGYAVPIERTVEAAADVYLGAGIRLRREG
jgi:acetoin utilization deacetylase AcuC-like enzyme